MSQDVEKMTSSKTSSEDPTTTIQQEIESLMMSRNRIELPTVVTIESISSSTLKILNSIFIDEESKQFKTKYILMLKSNYNEFINYFVQQIQQTKSTPQDIVFGISMLGIICYILSIESISCGSDSESINTTLLEIKKSTDIHFFTLVLSQVQQLTAKNYFLMVYHQLFSLLIDNDRTKRFTLDQTTIQYAYQFIIKDCQKFITSVDNIQTIFMVLDVFDVISELAQLECSSNGIINYVVMAMQNGFRDVMDIIVGWFLDRNTIYKQKIRIGESLEKLPSALWEGKHLDFTGNLIQRFVNDMSSLSDERQYQTFVICLRYLVSSLNTTTFYSILNRNKSIISSLLDNLFVTSLTKFTDKKKQVWKSISECVLVFSQKVVLHRKIGDNSASTKTMESEVVERTMSYIGNLLVLTPHEEIIPEYFTFIQTIIKEHEASLPKPIIKKFVLDLSKFAAALTNIDVFVYLELAKIFDIVFNKFFKANCLEILKWVGEANFDRLFIFGMIGYSIDKGNASLYKELLDNATWISDMVKQDEMTFIEMIKKLRSLFPKFKQDLDVDNILKLLVTILNEYMASRDIQKEILLWLYLIYSVEERSPTEIVLDTLHSILESDCSVDNKLTVLKIVVECLSKIDTDKYSMYGTTQLLNCFYKCLESGNDQIFNEAVESIKRCGHILVDESASSEFKWFRYYSSPLFEELPDISTLNYHFEKLFTSFEKISQDPFIYKSVPFAVLYCIVNRLKTPFGGAMATFEGFEKLLQSCPENENLHYFISELQRQVNAVSLGVHNNLFNAQTLSFFTGNQKVCNDWFNRLQSQMSGRIIHNGLKSLIVEKERPERIESLLIAICTTLCEEYCDSEVLHGVLSVMETEFSKIPSFIQLAKAFMEESQGRFEQALQHYQSVTSFFDEKNKLKINDRILLCQFYLKTSDNFDILKLANGLDFTPVMNKYIESNRKSKDVDVAVKHSNRHDDLILSKSDESSRFKEYCIRRYLHQNVIPFVSKMVPIQNLNKVKISPKNGIIVRVDQNEIDTPLIQDHLTCLNIQTAHNIIDSLGVKDEKSILKIDELYAMDHKEAILKLSSQITVGNKDLAQNMPFKLYNWIDQNQKILDSETMTKIGKNLGIASPETPSIPSVLKAIVSVSENSVSLSQDHLHIALDYLEKYDTENKNRLQIYKNILQYQNNLSRLEVIKIVAKLLEDLEHFDENEFTQFVEDIDYRIWIPLIPQIFSLFGEYYPYIKSVILKLGKHRLQSIIYPSVVRYLEHAKNGTDIIAELRKINPEMVNSVVSFVLECKRMTHTWFDLWLQTLTGCRKYLTKTGIKSQKFQILLEQTYNVTMNAEPESKVEQMFQIQYQSILNMIYHSLLELSFRSGEISDDEIDITKQKLLDLTHQISRSSIFREFNAEDVVPKLLNYDVLKNIPIPGLHLHGTSNEDSLVTIESISSKVKVLGSKTKPKKIVFMGNNGKYFKFLLKGKEDLRLDQRMQQFIGITNMIFKYSDNPHLRNRAYDVTPLGKNCGLIEWIDNTQTIFSLYKKKDSIYKPMDHYYKCLLPIIKSENITKQPYPTSVLKKVYSKCKSTIDKEEGINSVDTLQRHILFNPDQTSINSSFESQRNFVLSTACMSTIGYVVGLGDRHLDNILMDSYTNEVIHIDYQICFNQGSNLPVPEIVPFRLTPCIAMAIGDGVMRTKFSSVCEKTLSSLHKEKNLLLKLLMTFISDPLIDQTSDQQLYSIFDKQLDSLFLEQVIEKKEIICDEFKATAEGIATLDVFDEVPSSDQTQIEEYCLILDNKKKLQQELEHLSVSSFENIPMLKEKLEKERSRISGEKSSLNTLLEDQLKKFSDESHLHFNLFNTLKTREFNNSHLAISISKPEPLLRHVLPYLSIDFTDYKLREAAIEEKQMKLRNINLDLTTSLREIQLIYKSYTDMEYISHDIKYVISNVLHRLLICKDASQFDSIIRSISEPEQELVENIREVDDELEKMNRDLVYLENKQVNHPPLTQYGQQTVDCSSLLNQLMLEVVESSNSMQPSDSQVYDLCDWCGFRNLLKIEGCITFCYDSVPTIQQLTPTKDQLALLSNGISNITSAIRQFLDNLMFVIIPEFITALSQSDAVRQLLASVTTLFQTADMTPQQKMLAYQLNISNKGSSANVLCLAFDSQFSQLEIPFKELSLIPGVTDLIIATKLDTLNDIFIELLNYNPSYNQSLFNILNIMKDHIDTFVEKITIPTLTQTLQQWNIYDPYVTNNFNSNEVLVHTIQKLYANFEEFGNAMVQKLLVPRTKECFIRLQHLIWNNQFSGQLSIKNKDIVHWKELMLEKLEKSTKQYANTKDELYQDLIELQNLESTKYLAICKPLLNESQFNGLLTNIASRNMNYDIMLKAIHNEVVLAKSILTVEKKDRQLPFDTSDMESIYGAECYGVIKRLLSTHEKEIQYNKEFTDLTNQKERYDEIQNDIAILVEKLKEPELVNVQSNQMNYSDLIRSKFIAPYKQLAKTISSYMNMISQLISVLQSMIELSSFHKVFRQYLQMIEAKLTTHYEVVNQYFIDCNDSLEFKKDSTDSLFHYQHHTRLTTRTRELKNSVDEMFDYTIEQINEISKQIEEQSYIESVHDDLLPPQQKNSNNNYDGNFIVNLVGKRLNEADSEEKVKSIITKQIDLATSEENLSKMYKGWIPWL